MNFSLDWFKSKRQKELENLKIEEQKMKNELLKRELHENDGGEEQGDTNSPPYFSIKLVGTTLTVILKDGSLLSKSGATIDDFKKARGAFNEAEILTIMADHASLEKIKREEEERTKVLNIRKNFDLLKSLPDFSIKNDSVYMNPINRSMPALLVDEFISIVNHVRMNLEGDMDLSNAILQDVKYQSLKKFWLKCCLNPNARSAEDLYEFLKHHKFKIDKHGNFYAYRRVVSKNTQNKELVEFISNTYTKVKAVWKKSPKSYKVFEVGNDKDEKLYVFGTSISESKIQEYNHQKEIGNLEELYLNLPNMQKDSYTSAHTGMEDYRVGEVISMPRNDGNDDNTISCSRGFHAASKAYDYTGFGDTPILVIINPMDVLAVPKGEVGKLRTCRWFFAMTLPEDEKYILDDDDFDVTELGDIFEEKCLENMTEYVQNSFAEEVKRHTFTLSNISSIEVSNVVHTLEQMKDILSDRVIELEEDWEDEF